jgi:sugar phosphate isomerase/epimerase
MMGDGVIALRRIRGAVEDAGYDGFCEVEIFSEQNWWKHPGEAVVQTCIERYRRVC